MVTKSRPESKAKAKKGLPKWAGLEQDELESTIVKIARDGKSSAAIGLILRDQYAVPSVRAASGKTISQIIQAAGVTPEVPEDVMSLMRRAVSLRQHLKEHRKDHQNARGLQLIESRIRRLAYYYKKKGKLPPDWKYSGAHARITAE